MSMIAMAAVLGVIALGFVAASAARRRFRAAAFTTQSLRYVRESIDEA